MAATADPWTPRDWSSLKEGKRRQKGERARSRLPKCPEFLGGIPARGETTTPPTPPVASRVVIIGGAGFELGTERAALVAALAPFSPIDTVAPPGRVQSFAWFATPEAATRAAQSLNGTRPNGLPLPLSFAYGQEQLAPRSPTVIADPAHVESAIPGLRLLLEYISAHEEAALLDCCGVQQGGDTLAGSSWSVQRHRAVRHFGFSFDYATNDATEAAPCPLPPPVGALAQRLCSADGLMPFPADQVTVNRYLPGDGIPSHVDNVDAFADGIASVSLAADTVMVFQRPSSGMPGRTGLCAAQRVEVVLPRRSALVMCGESRFSWEHGIAARTVDIIDDAVVPRFTRVSLTFRTRAAL